MSDETFNKKMADQIPVIVIAARERFADQIEQYLKGKKISIKEVDKRRIEQLFSDTVHTYIIAELAAITSYSIYGTLKNDEILTKIVPALLDQIESNIGQIPDSMAKKTGDLPACAKKVIESKKEKPAVVVSLLKDLSEMPKMKHLTASFNGTLLNFMGE